jgi:hypothetical protein
MILNAYAVLDGFVSLLRLGLGLLVLALWLAGWRGWRRRAADPERRKDVEDRCYLLFMLGGLLVVLNVLSWPLLYLLLQSYVPEWPGVMCIYGVTKIGSGAVGPARFLPPLLTALQLMKPALVFLCGSWFALYLVNRASQTAPLTGRVLLVLLAAGLVAAADAASEIAYLVIPKKEEPAYEGCCTEAFDAESAASRFAPPALTGPDAGPRLYATYYLVNAGMALALGFAGRLRRLSAAWLAPLLLGAALSTAVNAVFLIDAAAPRLLHLPYHHCPYDLAPKAPESLVAIALFLGGAFCVGWACIGSWLGGGAESRTFQSDIVRRLLRLAFVGYLGSMVMLSVELALA